MPGPVIGNVWLRGFGALALLGVGVALLAACGKGSEDKKLNAPLTAPPPSAIPEAGPVSPPPATGPVDLGNLDAMDINALNELALKAEQSGEIIKAEQIRLKVVEKAKAQDPRGQPYLDAIRTLGFFYHFQGRAADAERVFLDLIKLTEEVFGPEDSGVADAIVHLTGAYNIQGKFEYSEPLYSRVVAIREKAYGANSPQVEQALRYHAGCLRNLGRNDEAGELERKADAIKAANESSN